MFDHLTAKAREALLLDDLARVRRVRGPRWIGYPRAKQVLAKLEELLTCPPSHRMPNLLIVGDTNNGKTMLVNRFQSLHPPRDVAGEECAFYPVLTIQAPPAPDEGRLYNALLEQIGAPYKENGPVDKKQFQVIKTFKHVGLRVLIIDEIHDLLSGPVTKQKQFLNAIKYLGNQLQIPIVAVGIKEAFNALQTDPQLSNRFEPAPLPKWEIGDEYLSLLASFEKMLPLRKPSNLTDSAMALRLLGMSEGTIGELAALLTRAAVRAIERGSERITKSVLDAVDWTPPSERKWKAAGRA